MRYLIANLKMNLISYEENISYLTTLLDVAKRNRRVGVKTSLVICPSFPFLSLFQKKLPKRLFLGAQDVAFSERGAYTGYVPARSLADNGASFVLIGHSESRRYGGDTNERISEKIRLSVRNGLRPVLCVGESAAERAAGQTALVIRRQISEALHDISSEEWTRGIIAYEPCWAIGTDHIPRSDDILEVSIAIRRTLVEILDRTLAESVPILYGGSVNVERISEVCLAPGLSGVLVGRESLLPEELLAMVSALDA